MYKAVCVLACATLGFALLGGPARAAVAPSRGRVETLRDKNLRRVRRLLQEKEVRRQLAKIGMNREEIEKRLANAEDAEIEHLADRLDSMAAGRGALGVVVALLVIAALVLLIIWMSERV